VLCFQFLYAVTPITCFFLPYRWFIEKAQVESSCPVELRLLEMTIPNAEKLLSGSLFYSKTIWEHTQHPHPNPKNSETHLYFKKRPEERKRAIQIQVETVEPVCPQIIELDTELYAMVLISGLSPATRETSCVQSCDAVVREMLSTLRNQKLSLVLNIQKLCCIWGFSGNHLDSEEALKTAIQSVPSLQSMVDIFTRQPINLQMAASRLTVFLVLMCKMDSEQNKDYQALNQIMSTAAVYAVQCCSEELLNIRLNLVTWFDQKNTEFVSGGLVSDKDKTNWLHSTLTGDHGLDSAQSLGEIVSRWNEFSAQKTKNPTKIISLLQHLLENKIVSDQLSNDSKDYCSALLLRVQTLWHCIEDLCKYFSKCSFSGLYLYTETFSLQEQILASKHAVLIEKAILAFISKCHLHIQLRTVLSDLFCRNNDCLAHMQVVYAEGYDLEYAGISARLIVTASNIHKWFPFLQTKEFFQCLQTGIRNPASLSKILCLHLGSSHEMGLIPSDCNTTTHLGNMHKKCLRLLTKLKISAEKFIPKHSTRTDSNSWLRDDSGVSISPIKNLVVFACMRKQIYPRCKSTEDLDKELNFAFGVSSELLWQSLGNFQDSFRPEHSKFLHSPESLVTLPEPDSGGTAGFVLQLDKLQASLDIYSSFSGFNIDSRCNYLQSKARNLPIVSSKRDILLFRSDELHSTMNQDILKNIYRQIKELNANGLECQGDKTCDQQIKVDGDMMANHDISDFEPGLLDTPEKQLHSPHAAKFSNRKKRKANASAGRRLLYPSLNKCLLIETTMNKDEYFHACRLTAVLRQVQINAFDNFGHQKFDCQFLSVAAVLPNPNPNILSPLYVLIAQIPSGTNGRTSLFSSCCCSQCVNKPSQTTTINFFNSVKIIHLRRLCMCVDAMQHVLKQCISMLPEAVNQFCGFPEESDVELKIENSFCVYHSESAAFQIEGCSASLKVVSIPNPIGVVRSDSKKYLSVIVQKQGSQETRHAIIYVSTVQKQRLKELCKLKQKPETQLYCLECKSFYVTNRGHICSHNKAAHLILHPPKEIRAQDNSDSEDIDSDCVSEVMSSDLDDQEANDCGTEGLLQSDKKQACESSQSMKEKEYFDPKLAESQTGYVMLPTLSAKQKRSRLEIDGMYSESPQIKIFVEKQRNWTLQEYLTKDKTMFDLCCVAKFEEEFLPPDTCHYCSHERSKESASEEMTIMQATVYLSTCQICNIPAKCWHCKHCNEMNHYDGSGDGIWFHSPTLAVSVVLILRQLKGFVHGSYPTFSNFVQNHNDLVKAAMFNAPVAFMSEKTWRELFFSTCATGPNLRFPCSLCLRDANGSDPEDLTNETLDKYKRKAPPHVWDSPGIIQDAIANFVENRPRPDLGAGTHQAFPIEQGSSILDRCAIPTGGFIKLKNGQTVYKNAVNATSEQRQLAKTLREMFKSEGKRICDLFHMEMAEIRTFKINGIEQMKHDLRSAWHAKQKEEETEHPLSLLLDVLNAQKFPSVWPYVEKFKFMYTCGIVLQLIGAQASVLTLIKDFTVPLILKFCRTMFDTYGKLDLVPTQADMLMQNLQTLGNIRRELLETLAPNSDSIPADPTIVLLLNFTSAAADSFLEYRELNLAISSLVNYLAYSVCEISSRHNILIEGCESTNIFNLATDTQRYRPVLPLRSHFSQDSNVVESEPARSGAESEVLAGYNPVLHNCALYFNPEARQIRSVPYTGVVIGDKQDGDCTKTSYKDDAALGQRNSTDMLSVFQCLWHCIVIGYAIIFKGEGRKDSYYPLAAFKETAPALFVYDNACAASSFCLSRQVFYNHMSYIYI
jgi:hypothetical protein